MVPTLRNGTLIIQGDINKILVAMKRTGTWSSSYSQQDEKIENILKNFNSLKVELNNIESLNTIDSILFLDPFLEVITSDQTSSAVTSLALVSINTFLSYGLIEPDGNNVANAVCKIAEAVTRAKFSSSDLDDVVLMRILLVLRNLVLSPIGVFLTNENVCEIMSSIFRVCFETRLPELLRKYAEHCLKDIVQCLFTQLSNFLEDSTDSANVKSINMRSPAVDPSQKRKYKKLSRGESQMSPDIDNNKSEGEEKIIDNIHLATSPCTPLGPVLDMQGDIHQSVLPSQDIQLSSDTIEQKVVETVTSEGAENVNSERPNSLNIPLNEEPKLESNQDNLESTIVSTGEDDTTIVSTGEVDPSIEDSNSFTGEDKSKDVTNNEHDKVLVPENSVIQTEINKRQPSSPKPDDVTANSPEEYINTQGVRFTASDPVEEAVSKSPYGIVSVREILRCLIQLCDPHNKTNSDSMIHIGISLLSVAFEVGADSIAHFPSLMLLVKDDLCRYLMGLLLTADRLTIFSANLQLLFLVFESMRFHLKFQFECYLSRLLEIISSDNQRIKYGMKEIALESVVQLWRIPGLVTELYLNYDCDLYCPNLYEDQTKMLSKNCFPVHGIENFHLLSLNALLTVIDSIENYCKQKTLNENIDNLANLNKQKKEIANTFIPSHEELMAIKRKKKLLTIGTEQFNMNSKKGIKFLQEQGLLSTPQDPIEIVHFLRENPHLDKKTIGEYLSNRSNLTVLDQFVKSFDFTNMRIDYALRMYLETFRLPGESPLISLLMEQFADHWHKSNNEPFANSDAAFTLIYAIIMLNVDQHNYNVKRQNNPMTMEGFKKNLKSVNGGQDFDQTMLDNIYKSIKEEEIVMPAEQTGLVRENYLWKVLLKRGQGKDGNYITAPGGQHNNYNHDLFSIIFTPTVAALSFVFDKSNDTAICGKAMTGFRKCAMIAAYYGMSNEFDNLTQTLCKFSTLLNIPETPDNPIAVFGCNTKAKVSTKTVFDWAHRHGDILREGWKPILDCILQLYKWKLLPKILVEAEDFLELSGKVSLLREETSISTKNDKGFFSTFYNSLSLIAFAADQPLQREPTSEEQKYIEQAQKCIMECPLEVLITESKFFRMDSLQEFVKALMAASYGAEGRVTLETSLNEDTTVFFLEFLLKVVIQNRDRVSPIWQSVRDHLYTLLMRGAASEQNFLVERTIVGLLRLAIRLMSREEMSPVVLQSLRMLLLLKWATLNRTARQIAYGLFEMLKTSAANIHTDTDWSIIFTLLECVGAGRLPPRVVGQNPSLQRTGAKSDGEITCCEEDSGIGNERGYTSDSELSKHTPNTELSPELSPNTGSSWILVGSEGEIQPYSTKPVLTNEFFITIEKELFPHDPFALVKCCESLAFLVRDAAHITPYNFENCVRCIRTFVEAILETGERKRPGKPNNMKEKSRKKIIRKKSEDRARSPTSSPYDADESDPEELPSTYPRVYNQLLDLMHTLHVRTAQIYRWWADENLETEMMSLWSQGWCPLLQGIARLCCDTRKEVRMSAITYLQRALLVHDLQTLTGDEWESCFNSVLFPLLAKLLEDINDDDVIGMEETRMRAATLLSKVFLHHLSPLLVLPSFTNLWLNILDFMDRYMHADGSDLLGEAIPESLKNILLVMDSAKVFSSNDGYSYLWTITWERINNFLPHLKEELFKSHPAVEGFEIGGEKDNTNKIRNDTVGSPNTAPQQNIQVNPPNQLSPIIQNQFNNNIPQSIQNNLYSDITNQNYTMSNQNQGYLPTITQVSQCQMSPIALSTSNLPSMMSSNMLISSPPSSNLPSNMSISSLPYQNIYSPANPSSFSTPPSNSFINSNLPSAKPIPSIMNPNMYNTSINSNMTPITSNMPMIYPNIASNMTDESISNIRVTSIESFLSNPSSISIPVSSMNDEMYTFVQQEPSSRNMSNKGFMQYNSTISNRMSETELPLPKVDVPHPIINIVTQPQSYSTNCGSSFFNQNDPGAPPQLTEEVLSSSTAIPVPARHVPPLFPQLISTPAPLAISSSSFPSHVSPPSDSILSAFVPTPTNSLFTSPVSNNNLYTIFPGRTITSDYNNSDHQNNSSLDRENAKNFFYQNSENMSTENNFGIQQANNMGSPPKTSSGILLNPDLATISSLPSVISPPEN